MGARKASSAARDGQPQVSQVHNLLGQKDNMHAERDPLNVAQLNAFALRYVCMQNADWYSCNLNKQWYVFGCQRF